MADDWHEQDRQQIRKARGAAIKRLEELSGNSAPLIALEAAALLLHYTTPDAQPLNRGTIGGK